MKLLTLNEVNSVKDAILDKLTVAGSTTPEPVSKEDTPTRTMDSGIGTIIINQT